MSERKVKNETFDDEIKRMRRINIFKIFLFTYSIIMQTYRNYTLCSKWLQVGKHIFLYFAIAIDLRKKKWTHSMEVWIVINDYYYWKWNVKWCLRKRHAMRRKTSCLNWEIPRIENLKLKNNNFVKYVKIIYAAVKNYVAKKWHKQEACQLLRCFIKL